MLRTLSIFSTSFRMALEELRNNRLRTFLSLFGITIGIFCIISVMATVGSLDATVHQELKAMGTNVVFIQKWPWDQGPNFPWWKYITRPNPKWRELSYLKDRAPGVAHAAFVFDDRASLEYQDAALTNVNWFGLTEEFNLIQPVDIGYGRYFTPEEFNEGSPDAVIGYVLAQKLFDDAAQAVGKEVELKGRRLLVIGVISKQGNSLIGGWDFDHDVLLPLRLAMSIGNPDYSENFLLVNGKEGVPLPELKGELRGAMRTIRRLSPRQDDNFSLNDVTSGTSQLNAIFGGLTVGGLAITILSFIVGIFGVANIMFVTVRERTSLIGLKKAIGAKRRTILLEFLLEAAFLCVLGGLMGLALVFPVTLLLSGWMNFSVAVSPGLFVGAILLCIFTGMLAGIIPATVAARMDPVVAIRST